MDKNNSNLLTGAIMLDQDHTKLPILYTFVRCPWAMRARLALAFMNIEYEPREVDLKNKPQALLNISPKGTVPVLLFPDGQILEESLDIVLWAMPKSPIAQQTAIDAFIHENDNNFKFNNYRYKYPERYLAEGQSQEFYRAECEKFIQTLDQALIEHQFLINDDISIADVAIFPMIRQFSMVDNAWFIQAPYHNVQRWLNYISARGFFVKAMQKLPVWRE